MKHKCVKCGTIYATDSEEILTGCKCGSRLFYFVKDKSNKKNADNREQIDYFYELENGTEITIFDIESVNILSKGKYEININALMKEKKNNLIYKYGDGKYSVDITSEKKKRGDKQKLF